MTTGLSVITVFLAAWTVLLGWRTLQSQRTSAKLFQDMNNVLHQMQGLQQALNARELRVRQERARQAVEILMKALRRQVSVLDGQWVSLSFKTDPLEPVRMYEAELSWIPKCEWKKQYMEVLRAVGPLPHGSGVGLRADQWTTLTNGCRDLEPAGQLHCYEDCLKAIDAMR